MAKERGDVGTSRVSSPVSGPNPMAAPTKGRYGQDYNKDGRISFGERFRDATDGGGPGVSGGPFRGGGLLSAFGNAITGNRGMGVGPEAGVGFAGYGYQGPNGWVTAAQDMMNGGGPGMMGPTFRGGGHYSGILNFLGVTPRGAGDLVAPEMTVGTEKTPALTQVLAEAAAPAAQPMVDYTNSGATPATAYGRFTPGSTYDEAALYASPMQMVPGVTPAQITPNDYYSAMLSQMQRFR